MKYDNKKEMIKYISDNIEKLCDAEWIDSLNTIYIEWCSYWADFELQFENWTILWHRFDWEITKIN